MIRENYLSALTRKEKSINLYKNKAVHIING